MLSVGCAYKQLLCPTAKREFAVCRLRLQTTLVPQQPRGSFAVCRLCLQTTFVPQQPRESLLSVGCACKQLSCIVGATIGRPQKTISFARTPPRAAGECLGAPAKNDIICTNKNGRIWNPPLQHTNFSRV